MAAAAPTESRDAAATAALEAQFGSIKPESVIEVTGTVQGRIEAAVNPNLATGEIEVHASELMIHNVSKTPPFPMDDIDGSVSPITVGSP